MTSSPTNQITYDIFFNQSDGVDSPEDVRDSPPFPPESEQNDLLNLLNEATIYSYSGEY